MFLTFIFINHNFYLTVIERLCAFLITMCFDVHVSGGRGDMYVAIFANKKITCRVTPFVVTHGGGIRSQTKIETVQNLLPYIITFVMTLNAFEHYIQMSLLHFVTLLR